MAHKSNDFRQCCPSTSIWCYPTTGPTFPFPSTILTNPARRSAFILSSVFVWRVLYVDSTFFQAKDREENDRREVLEPSCCNWNKRVRRVLSLPPITPLFPKSVPVDGYVSCFIQGGCEFSCLNCPLNYFSVPFITVR